jgi:hypothetical protein
MEDGDTLYPNGTAWQVRENGLRSYHSYREVADQDSWCYSMHCPTTAGGCGAEMPADSKQEAVDKWNTRV